MKYLVLIVSLLILSTTCVSQNLITNPSFENIDSCFGNASNIGFDVFQWSGCNGWSNPIASSSDLWCENPVIGTFSPPDVGVNFQFPHSGSNYAGILENGGTIINYREYIQNELQQELEKGKAYKLSFYYSSRYVECSMNVFQAIFSSSKMNDTISLWLTGLLSKTVSSSPNDFIVDSLGWNYGEIYYTAEGGEKYMVFGNFQDTTIATYASPCDTSFWGNISYAGNYFVLDDFSLEEVPMQYTLPNVFSPNNDGSNDNYTPNVINIPDWEMLILNRWGNVITKLNENDYKWSGKDCTDGVYFYIFRSNKYNIKEQGFIQLFR